MNAPACDTTSGVGECVGCRTSSDCASGNAVCDATTQQCVQCSQNSNCPTDAPRCLVSAGQCVQCLGNADCGASAPSPYGEIAWNHDEQHSRAYTAAEMIAGTVPVTIVMGRMACLETASHSEDIVWTTDYGKMLGVAIGAGSHSKVWLWWIAVHHNIIFPGTPMDMGDKSVTLMSGAPAPKTSASASPAMMASPAPSMSDSDG